MRTGATVWMTREDAGDLGIKGTELPIRILELKNLVLELLKKGSEQDIVVLPYFRNFGEVLGHIRARGIRGPIIIHTDGEIIQPDLLEYASQGVLFIDYSRFSPLMVLGFITFLQKQQDLAVSTAARGGSKPGLQSAAPARDTWDILALFRSILMRRARITLSCQFRESLPTLSATCEIIQIVGEIETRIVLDNFSPEEFVGLYSQFGRRKPLSGFFTHEGRTLGFDLAVDSCRRGRITVFLPESVFEQKRRFFRVEPDPKHPVTLHILPPGRRTASLTVRDVSEGGVGLVSSYAGLEKSQACPVGLALPQHHLMLGTGEVMFKGELPDGSFNYGISLALHSSDQQSLQSWVFRRQAGILEAIRNLKI